MKPIPFAPYLVAFVFYLLFPAAVIAKSGQPSDAASALRAGNGEWMQLTAEGRHEDAYTLAKKWEARSREADDPEGLYLSLWRIAMYHFGRGESRQSIEHYRESRENLRRVRDEGGPHLGTDEIALLKNLQSLYSGLGKLGELYIAQREMEDILAGLSHWNDLEDIRIIYDPESYKLFADRSPGLPGLVRVAEARIRANSGDLAGAITLVRMTIDHFNERESVGNWSMNTYMGAQYWEARWLVDIGRIDDAMEVWDALLAERRTYRSDNYYLLGLIHRSYQTLKRGGAPEPLFATVYAALEEIDERGVINSEFNGYRILALMYSHQGEDEKAFEILNETIERARTTHDEVAALGDLLLARVEVGLAHGRFDLVEADLVEALRIFRRLGRLRDEIAAFSHYAEYLAQLEEFERAEDFLNVAESLTARIEGAEDTIRLREAIGSLRDGIRAAIGAADSIAEVDLQPVQMNTRVAPGERARGRFVLVNTGEVGASGKLAVEGGVIGDFWDDDRNTWVIGAEPDAEDRVIVREVGLLPGEELVVLSETTGPRDEEHRLDISWSGTSELSAWWTYGIADGQAPRVSVVNTSIAIDNPFHAIPLYHEIYYRGELETIRHDLRVVTGTPCRVIIFDAHSGEVLAIDATGDGDFMGSGDVLFQDTDRTGFLDIPIHREPGVAAIELLVFPDKESVDDDMIEVEVQLLNPRGEWQSQAVNIIVLAEP